MAQAHARGESGLGVQFTAVKTAVSTLKKELAEEKKLLARKHNVFLKQDKGGNNSDPTALGKPPIYIYIICMCTLSLTLTLYIMLCSVLSCGGYSYGCSR